jgi:hypothetical protein
MPHNLITVVNSFMMLGEKPNFQKVTLPKSRLTENINQSNLVVLCQGWLYGKLTFWKLTISPTIIL